MVSGVPRSRIVHELLLEFAPLFLTSSVCTKDGEVRVRWEIVPYNKLQRRQLRVVDVHCRHGIVAAYLYVTVAVLTGHGSRREEVPPRVWSEATSGLIPQSLAVCSHLGDDAAQTP